MNIKELIQESLSRVVFHATGVRKAIDILEQDKFKLSADFAKPSESKATKPMFYLSTTRSRYGAYHTDNDGYVADFTVLFTLNGGLLNQRYKGASVDYWQMTNDLGIPMKDEMEDRLFSYDREIPAVKYITMVDILVDQGQSYKNNRKDLLYFYNLCKRRGLPVRFFSDRKSFLSGRNDVPVGELLKDRQEVSGFTGYSDSTRRYKPSKPSDLSQLVATHNYLIRGKLPPRELSEFLVGPYGYKRDYYKTDVIRRMANDMHNDTGKPIMQDVAKVMRYYRTNKIADVLDALLARYIEIGGDV